MNTTNAETHWQPHPRWQWAGLKALFGLLAAWVLLLIRPVPEALLGFSLPFAVVVAISLIGLYRIRWVLKAGIEWRALHRLEGAELFLWPWGIFCVVYDALTGAYGSLGITFN